MTIISKISRIVVLIALIISTAKVNAQKTVHITSTTIIDTSIEEVYNLIKDYERFPEWSPFLVADPEQKNNVTGENGELGSSFHWEGVAEKSLGFQTLSELKENKYAKMDCTVKKPFKANSTFEYYLVETNNGVEVRQEFKTQMNGFAYFMGKLFGMQKAIAKTNQLGLDRLKAVLETTELTSGQPIKRSNTTHAITNLKMPSL